MGSDYQGNGVVTVTFPPELLGMVRSDAEDNRTLYMECYEEAKAGTREHADH